ncbi:MAG TPA: SDR family oxidoreductase [Bacillales bacterium]|nr:SDR family oxidoreductase [Bacillales bacterium]
MKLLILGGTKFLGRHLTEAALWRGHQVTLFNRGRENPDLFSGKVEKLVGDRDGNLEALKGRHWDAVIDTSGYFPRIVGDSARLLAEAVDHYTFISSISVYDDFSRPDIIDETSQVGKLEDETVEDIGNGAYGPLKALCEQAVERAMPGRTLVIRPGLIVGPYDPTDRFTYWPCRIAKGGSVLAPGDGKTPVQFIDVRDLAEWTLTMVEQKKTGIYNATGPAETLVMKDFLETCQRGLNEEAALVWVDEKFLEREKVQGWTDLPVWIAELENMQGLSTVNIGKAVADGLKFRPLLETVVDTYEWASERPDDHEWRNGLDPERERELLKLWKNHL